MKKSVIKLLLLCIILAALVVWNGIYMECIFPDLIRCQPECTLNNLLILIQSGIKEECIFRYLPIIFSSWIYVTTKKYKNNWTSIIIILLVIFILCVQFIFSTLHIPLDPVYREILYELPPYPTFKELFDTFLLQGILGISLCVCYIIYIPKENPLNLFQIKSLIASCFVHIIHNQLIVILY